MPSASSDTSHAGRYWNDLSMVEVELRRRAFDSGEQTLGQQLIAWNGRPFNKAITLNCGDGWVERDLVRTRAVHCAVGLDSSESLLAAARQSAAIEHVDIDYHVADINTATFEFVGADLVINYASLNCVARLDHVMREACNVLPADGAFMSWEFIGPHRNQYPEHQWAAVERLNQSLPPRLRKRLAYPHLPTMLATDPTVAMHSELIMPTMRRYFRLDHVRYLGGALAYEVLCFNDAFFDGEDHSDWVQYILDADAAYMADAAEANSLFAFVIARPNKEALLDEDRLAEWAEEEADREAAAAAHGGRYYPDTTVAQRFSDAPMSPPAPRSLYRRVGSRAKRALRRSGLLA